MKPDRSGWPPGFLGTYKAGRSSNKHPSLLGQPKNYIQSSILSAQLVKRRRNSQA